MRVKFSPSTRAAIALASVCCDRRVLRSDVIRRRRARRRSSGWVGLVVVVQVGPENFQITNLRSQKQKETQSGCKRVEVSRGSAQRDAAGSEYACECCARNAWAKGP